MTLKVKQSGNALFLILIAVALFAALSYAVTQSGRGGGSIDRETASIQASQIVQFSQQALQAVQRVQLVSGCSETEVSFDHSSWPHTDYQFATRTECEVFNANGGGAAFQDVMNGVSSLPWEYEGGPIVAGIGTGTTTFGIQTTTNELLMYLPGVSLQVCNEINRGLGHAFSSPPIDANEIVDTPDRFDGDYLSNDGITGDPADSTFCGAAAELCGLYAACFQEGAGSQYYVFYNVLIAR